MNDINKAVITRVIRALNDGNLKYAESLGFSIDELTQIQRLSQDEIHHLSNTTVSFMNVAINHDIFKRLLGEANEEARKQKLIDRALFLGASIEILMDYFALTSSQVSSRRKLLTLEVVQGRTRKPTEEEEKLIWNEWGKYRDKVTQLDSIKALDCLMLITELLNNQKCSITLTMVYHLVKEWTENNGNA